MNIPRDGINELPTELLCNIFQLVVEPWNGKIDRCILSLVCRGWWKCVESSALLWTSISAHYGPTYVRRALEKSQGVKIDLNVPATRWSEMNLAEFLAEADLHIARWRSLGAVVEASLFGLQSEDLGVLATTQPPNLEHLALSNNGMALYEHAITIFGGAPAPATFRRLMLHRFPLAVEPLHLSGLTSLSLTQVATIRTQELLEILHRSPWLETLSLEANPNLVAIGSQASNSQPTELPKLVSLTLVHMDNGGTNCILSNIRVPHPARHVFFTGNVRGVSAGAILLTPDVAHLLRAPIPPTTDLPPQIVKVTTNCVHSNSCQIQFRGIHLSIVVDGEDHIQEMFRWLADGLGSEVAECPVHLTLGWSDLDPVRIISLPPPLVVKRLSISGDSIGTLRDKLYFAMARPHDLTSYGWHLPQIETLSVTFEKEDSPKQFVSMLRNRYEGVNLAGGTGSRCPMKLRSVKLRGRPRPEGLVEEIKRILGEVNVFWARS